MQLKVIDDVCGVSEAELWLWEMLLVHTLSSAASHQSGGFLRLFVSYRECYCGWDPAGTAFISSQRLMKGPLMWGSSKAGGTEAAVAGCDSVTLNNEGPPRKALRCRPWCGDNEGSSISPVSYRVAGGCYQHSREVGRLPESAAAAARSGLPEEQQSHLLVRSSPPPLWSAASSHLASSSHSFSFTQSPFSPPIPPLPSRSSVIALSHSGWLHFFFSAPLALFLSPSFLLLQLIPNNKDFIFGPSSKPKSLWFSFYKTSQPFSKSWFLIQQRLRSSS